MGQSTKQTMTLLGVIAVIVAVVYVAAGGQIPTFAAVNFGNPSGSNPITQGATVCDSQTSPTLTVSCVDVHSTGTSLAGTNLKWRIKGTNAWTSTVCGGTIATDPASVLEIAVASDNVTVYGKTFDYTMPCSDTPTLEVQLAQVATVSSTSVVVHNPDGTVNSASNTYALAAGDTKTFPFEISGQYKKDFGSANAAAAGVYSAMVCNYNYTVISSLDVPEFTLAAQTPTLWTTTAGFKTTTWNIPAIVSNGKITGNLIVTASETNNPLNNTETWLEAGSGLNCTIYDSQLYLDTKGSNNDMKWGVEDENNANVGSASVINFRPLIT